MATVNVTSWAEFLEAAAVSGDTVVCPENAVWDLAELEPEGHTETITIASNIDGNGCTIKNLVLKNLPANSKCFSFTGGSSTTHQQINSLNIINADITGDGSSTNYLFGGNWVDYTLCTVSALVHKTNIIFGSLCNVYRCAFNIEFTAYGVLVGDRCSLSYCNSKFSGASLSAFNLYRSGYSTYASVMYNCYTVLDTPEITQILQNGGNSNVYRCTGANVTQLTGLTDSNHISLAVTTDFPNVTTVSAGFVLVTEAQLRDAAYLQSIGFPIGV